jgi:signal transduction histidine kinase
MTMDLNQLLHSNFMQRFRGRLLLCPGGVSDGPDRMANLAWQESTGMPAQDLLTLPLDQLVRPLPAEAGEASYSIRCAHDVWMTLACQVRRYGDWLELILPHRADGSPGPAELADQLGTILRITTGLRHKGGPALIEEIGQACKQLTRASRTTIFIVNDDDTLSPIFTDDPLFRETIMSLRVPAGSGLTGHVIQQGRAMIVNDAAHSPITQQIPGTPVEEEALLSVPLVAGERVLGALTLVRPVSQPFSRADLEIMSIMAAQVTDVLAEQELVDRLAASERNFRSLVENAEVGLYRLDLKGQPTEINPWVRRLLQIPAGEIPHPQDLWGSEDSHNRFVERVTAEQQVTGFDVRTLSRDGRILDLQISGRLLPERGSIEGVVIDLTRQHRHEQESRDRLVFLENFLSQNPQALLVLKSDGSLSHLNGSFESLFRLTRRDLLPESGGGSAAERICALLPPLRQHWESALLGQTQAVEDLVFEQRLAAGAPRELHLAVTVFPIRNRVGNLTEVVFLFQDISRRIQLQRQLVRAQKLESIGSLAGGFAHDFKNILATIQGNAAFLKLRSTDDSELARIADTIERATAKADNLTRQLLGMSREGPEQRRRVDLNILVEDTLQLLARGVPRRITLGREPAPVVPPVLADPEQIEQVLLNLVLNSADAITGEGRITVSTRVRRLDPETMTETDGGRDFVELEVRDTGCGIPAELQTRIFDPFFTTKAEGKGTGLGLAMVDGIVRAHGGRVELASRVDVGTRFRILLPAVDLPAGGPQAPVRTGLPAGTEHIMVVDDEEVIRDMILRILQNLGYRAVAFSSGSEALAYFREHGESVDLVILDMMMPEMSGLEVHERLVAIRSSVRILVCSGYSDQDSSALLNMPAIHGFLQKPFSISAFSQNLRRILDS